MATDKRQHFHRPAFAAGELLDEDADADDLAALEGVREAEKCHRAHAPGGEIVAGRNVQPDLPAERPEHHDGEDQHQKNAGGVAREEIKPVEENADHAQSRPMMASAVAGMQ